MHWRGEGVILSLRLQGEAGVTASLLTPTHGRHLGFHRGTGARLNWRQPGTRVLVGWSSRRSNGLGYWSLEPVETPVLRYFGSPAKLLAISAATAWIDSLLPERAPAREVYAACILFLEGLGGTDWLETYGRLEEALLFEAGLHPGIDFGKGRQRLVGLTPLLAEAAKGLGRTEPIARRLLLSPRAASRNLP